MPITAEFIGFHGKKLKKCGGKFIKCRVLWPKTSDFLGTNLRTFHAKPPYFVAKKSDVSGFPAGNVAKIPLFPILRYFGAKQGVVASEAILSPLTTGAGGLGDPKTDVGKYCTLFRFALNPWRRFYGDFRSLLVSGTDRMKAFRAEAYLQILTVAAGIA